MSLSILNKVACVSESANNSCLITFLASKYLSSIFSNSLSKSLNVCSYSAVSFISLKFKLSTITLVLPRAFSILSIVFSV